MRRSKSIASILLFAAVSTAPTIASAQLLGSMSFNQGVGAENDSPPGPHGIVTDVVSTVVPFQKTVSANNGIGAYVTATYNLADNGTVASISISASGQITANGSLVAEGTTNPTDTTFQLLTPSRFNAVMVTSGPATGELTAYDGYIPLIFLATSASSLSDSESGIAPVGLINFNDQWGTGYNDPPPPADESGTYSLTLTFTAIPEPSAATLLAISAAGALGRRRGRLVPLRGDR